MSGHSIRLLLLAIAGLASLLAVTFVAAQSTSTETVEVRVWRNVADPERLHLSTRPAGGAWTTHQTPLDMSELSRTRRWHQSSIVSIDLPAPEPSELAGIDDSEACAAAVALLAEHLAEVASVHSCVEFNFDEETESSGVRGIVVIGQNHAAFRALWTRGQGLGVMSWNEMGSFPFMDSRCFSLLRRFGEEYAEVRSWDCMTRDYVKKLLEDGSATVNLRAASEELVVERHVLIDLMDTSGGAWAILAAYRGDEDEPTAFRVTGSKPSQFHGIDNTSECAAVVAFVEEHFAETTSIMSCEGQARGAGTMRGLLDHRNEPATFIADWSEADGITMLEFQSAVTLPFAPQACPPIRDWLAERHGFTAGTCMSVHASVKWPHDGTSAPYLTLAVRGVLGGPTQPPEAPLSERPFEAWALDGETTPYAYQLYDGPAGLVYPRVE